MGDRGKKKSELAQIFKSNRMGTALCFLNPMEDSICKRECKRLEKAKDRQSLALFQVQKKFLVKQFLEKGLNPCIAPNANRKPRSRKQLTCEEEKVDPDNVQKEGNKKETAKDKLKRVVSFKMNDITPRSNHSKDVWDFTTYPRSATGERLPGIQDTNSSRPGYERSRTMVNIQLHRPSKAPNSNFPPITQTESPTNDDESVTSDKASKSAKEKRTLEYLKAHPEDLFPRLKILLKANGEFFPQPDDKFLKERSDKTASELSNRMKYEDEEDAKTDYYIKMLQRIQAYLPSHLVGTAEDQVKEMSKSDAIQEHKKKLLEATKVQMDRGALLSDDRWKVLHENLCSTYSAQWRKLYSNRWILGDSGLSSK